MLVGCLVRRNQNGTIIVGCGCDNKVNDDTICLSKDRGLDIPGTHHPQSEKLVDVFQHLIQRRKPLLLFQGPLLCVLAVWIAVFVLYLFVLLVDIFFSEDWSVVDGQGSGSESSDNYTPEHEVRNRPRPVPRPNARVPPVVPKPKDPVPRKKANVLSPQKVPSRVRKLESEESDEDDYDDYDDDDDENNRNSVRRAAVTISRYVIIKKYSIFYLN